MFWIFDARENFESKRCIIMLDCRVDYHKISSSFVCVFFACHFIPTKNNHLATQKKFFFFFPNELQNLKLWFFKLIWIFRILLNNVIYQLHVEWTIALTEKKGWKKTWKQFKSMKQQQQKLLMIVKNIFLNRLNYRIFLLQ